MASTSDSWVKEYNEAAKLADDINGSISEKAAISASGSESQRHFSAVRRKITILGTRLDSLEALLFKLPRRQPITEKELNRRKDMLANLRSKASQMASTLNMSNFGNRDSLLGPEIKPVDAMSRTAGLDNHGVVGLQRQIMRGNLLNYALLNSVFHLLFLLLLLLPLSPFQRLQLVCVDLDIFDHGTEQDDGLEKLEETVISTKHVALAVNEELSLHTRLIDSLDHHVEVTGSRLQRVARNLAILNKRTKESCSCLCLLLSVAGIVILILVIWVLVKYL